MKKARLLLLIFCSIYFTILQGQVVEREKTMSLGNQNSLVIELENTTTKTAENIWKEFVKEYGKVKKNRKAKEFCIEQTNIPSISGNNLCDVYAKFEEREGMVNAYFWVDLGDSFLSSEQHKGRFQGARTLLTEYGYAVQKHNISKELEIAKKTLKNFNKDMGKLIKDNTTYHKEIGDANEKIRKAEIKIEKNIVSQNNKTVEIEAQTILVKKVKERLNTVGKKQLKTEVKGEEKNDDGGR